MTINKSDIFTSIHKHQPSHIIVGFSGGVDSSVLLHICKYINIKVIAIYINHKLNPRSDDWESHCQLQCNNYKIDFLCHTLNSMPKGENFESWASKQRMDFFQNIMSKYDNPLLLLGHHRDDQAETFLLQAIRGSGLAGLGSIPKYKKLQFGNVMRPLLEYSKKDIIDYAKLNNIQYIYDNSNEDNKYRRNFIRNTIIPELEKINPSISETLSRSAKICSQSDSILNKLLTKELDIISNDKSLIVEKLSKLDSDIQGHIVHLWFKNITMISLKYNHLDTILKSISHKTCNTGWHININKHLNLVNEYGLLNIVIINPEIGKNDLLSSKQTILDWLQERTEYIYDLDSILIRDRRPDDRCRYIGRGKNNSLKKLFQELKISEINRHNAKILTLDNKIIAVYPFFVCP